MRDGNQALIEPMDAARKLRFFEQLVAVGLKEIEVAFPSASDTDFNFVRQLIEEERIPDDVTIEVLTQSRPDLIERTFESLRGARRAIVHLYNPIAPQWRRIVFGMSRDEIKDLALAGTRQIRALADADPGTEWIYEYSPETFSLAELDYALEVCDAVSAIWNPSPERKMIINLPSTVECASANVYADQIEWMHRRLARRDSIVLSVHPHNDRGTAVAAAELAVMAGADRVEGCLFGNGERTGNVDLVTLAMNLDMQGIPSGLRFKDMAAVRECVEACNQLPVDVFHPMRSGPHAQQRLAQVPQPAAERLVSAHDDGQRARQARRQWQYGQRVTPPRARHRQPGQHGAARPAATISFMASVLPSSITGLAARPAFSNQSSTSRRVRAPARTAPAAAPPAPAAWRWPEPGSVRAPGRSPRTRPPATARPGTCGPAGIVTRPISSALFSSPRSMSAVLPVLATTSSAGKRRRRSASSGGSR